MELPEQKNEKYLKDKAQAWSGRGAIVCGPETDIIVKIIYGLVI